MEFYGIYIIVKREIFVAYACYTQEIQQRHTSRTSSKLYSVDEEFTIIDTQKLYPYYLIDL